MTIGARDVKYLISFTLPRFCDQSLGSFAQGAVLSPATDAVDRQARHRDPRAVSHRSRAERHPPDRARGRHVLRATATVRSSSRRSREMVSDYLDTSPDPRGLRFSAARLRRARSAHGGVVGTSFRPFPSYPQRFHRAAGGAAAMRGGARRRRGRAVASRQQPRALSPKTICTSGISARDVAQVASQSARCAPRRRPLRISEALAARRRTAAPSSSS